uniref:Uncharacterized protein n=1 Tax=Heliothis virescens TaxID=7102 RepID=A0A2A4JNL6_HELVI
MVAELVQQFLLPHSTKTATRHRITMMQNARLDTARNICNTCGEALDQNCRCRYCPIKLVPKETEYRHDPRWKRARKRPEPPVKSLAERYPIDHEMRCTLTDLLDDVVKKSRRDRAQAQETARDVQELMADHVELTLDVKHILDVAVDIATTSRVKPVKEAKYYHTMRRIFPDALERPDLPPEPTCECPKELPSAIRLRTEVKPTPTPEPECRCDEEDETTKPTKLQFASMSAEEKKLLLPSELRELEQVKKCKCDSEVTTGPVNVDDTTTEYTDGTEFTSTYEEEEPFNEPFDETEY